MRIITGKYKGRMLHAPQGLETRPATDRVKTTIFNMLQNRIGISNIDVLDLFAGTGSLGFESLSRGARRVVFIDDHEDALDVIEKNAEELECIEQCAILRDDALNFISRSKEQFDLIFADPPYAYGRTQAIPEYVFEKQLLRVGGYLIIEHSKKLDFPILAQYQIVQRREFGNTHVSFFIHPDGKGEVL
jgi:16S rRNA (guanine966-N2)-methyltransferase